MANYAKIQEYVNNKYSFSVKTCWIAHMKEICGLPLRVATNRQDISLRTNPCPLDKRGSILSALLELGLIKSGKEIISKNSRWITALHEAGHAVVKNKLGGQVHFLFIKPDGPVYAGGANVEEFDLTTSIGRYKEMVVVLAGEVAVTVMGVPTGCRNDIAGTCDLKEIEKIMREDCLDEDGFIDRNKFDALLDSAYQEAVNLIELHKSEVVAIAQNLLDCEDGIEMKFPG